MQQEVSPCLAFSNTTVPWFKPATKSWTPQGRHQIKIYLNKGKNTIKLYNPVASRQDSAAIQYTNMGRELKRATKQFAEKGADPDPDEGTGNPVNPEDLKAKGYNLITLDDSSEIYILYSENI